MTVYWTWTDASGDIYATPMTKDLTFPAGSNVADAIQSMVSLAGGPEYELVPKEATNGDLATFNVYVPRQGDDMTALAFTVGVDDDDTLTGISYAPSIDGLINSYIAIGDVSGTQSMGGLDYPLHTAVQATHNASVATLRQVGDGRRPRRFDRLEPAGAVGQGDGRSQRLSAPRLLDDARRQRSGLWPRWSDGRSVLDRRHG